MCRLGQIYMIEPYWSNWILMSIGKLNQIFEDVSKQMRFGYMRLIVANFAHLHTLTHKQTHRENVLCRGKQSMMISDVQCSS